MIIDAHLHIWDRTRSTYAWLNGADPELARSFSLDDAFTELEPRGVSAAILVQADETAAETEYLIEQARADDRVRGVVVYSPLDDPETVASDLDRFDREAVVAGVRNLTHDRADPDWILRAEVQESIAIIAAHGLPLDYVAVLPRHLSHVPELASNHPSLTLVIDHLGTPPLGGSSAALEQWNDLIGEAARHPNVVAKTSGLYGTYGDGGRDAEALSGAVRTAIDHFGSERLLFGSDWPVCRVAGGAGRVLGTLVPIITALSARQRDDILHRTAERVYRVSAR